MERVVKGVESPSLEVVKKSSVDVALEGQFSCPQLMVGLVDCKGVFQP